jgi:predicted nuclease of predicted toxin-antitoxin system
VTVRFLADENLDTDIIQGLRAREPAIDILDVKTAGLQGAGDPALLELAAQQDRVLITHDRNTMTRHFRDRLHVEKVTPGVFILPQQERAIGEIIESLLLVWAASKAEEWLNQIVYLPFR